MRFDDALATYQQLYELRYQDPQWMEKIAEIYARQQRRSEAVEAIEKALISGRPERAENFFAAAERLESWNYLEDAAASPNAASQIAGDSLLQDYRYDSGAAALRASGRRGCGNTRPLISACSPHGPAEPNDFAEERLGRGARRNGRHGREIFHARGEDIVYRFPGERKSRDAARCSLTSGCCRSRARPG